MMTFDTSGIERACASAHIHAHYAGCFDKTRRASGFVWRRYVQGVSVKDSNGH